MSYVESGVLVSFNKEGNICGDDKPILECETVRELAKRAASVRLDTPTSIDDGWVGNGETNTTCRDCKKLAGVAVHRVAIRPTEELCFTFADPDLHTDSDTDSSFESEE